MPRRSRLPPDKRKTSFDDTMTVAQQKLEVGRCYQTAEGQVRLIVRFDGDHLAYVTERSGTFPVWNKLTWMRARRDAFAAQVEREVIRR